MSYRTFKHLLGETSLERKCRFIFGGGILILITGSFFWYGRKSEEMVYQETLNTCRMLVNPILLKHHWKMLEPERDFRIVIDKLFGELVPEGVKGFKFRFIRPLRADDPPDSEFRPRSDYEAAVLDSFLAGESDEEWQFAPSGAKYEYLAALRLNLDCRSCHPTLKYTEPGTTAKDGDLYAALYVSLPVTRTNAAIQNNRILLITTAVITALLGMIVSYAIVRYVIVKPVKHLKDVSEAVSGGNLDIRADIQTRDEFEELSHAFNRMLRNLVAMQEELRGVNRELDRKVDELAQANMALFETNRLKSDFLATMSHELRTPLNSIIGFSEVLSSNDKLSDKERRYASNIQSSGRMLLGLINDILDLAKIESGKMELHPEEFSLRDVLEGLITMARPIAERKSIEIETEIDAELPVLYQDSGKLQQVLYNLVDNAIKFTPENGRVAITARPDLLDVVIAVADNGVGIAPEDRDRIFEKFRQGRTDLTRMESALTRQFTGSGLGLSIVREICHMLGGDVSLESELGKGSTFTVRLPIRLERDRLIRVPLSDDRIDLSKARRVDSQVLASAAAAAE